jgi:hypothetical protein
VDTSVTRTSGSGAPPSVKGNRNRRRIFESADAELKRELYCGATQCTIIQCQVGPVTTNNRAVFRMRARVWAQTIADVSGEFDGQAHQSIALELLYKMSFESDSIR